MPDSQTFVSITEEGLRQMLLRIPNMFEIVRLPLKQPLGENPTAAFNAWTEFLGKCQQLERSVYEQQHKGTPFYRLGTAAFFSHDYQTAAFFYDAAVSEDIRAGANPADSSTPALKFMYIKGAEPDQAAGSLVQRTESEIEKAIKSYNGREGRPQNVPALQLNDIRTKFISHVLSSGNEHLRTLATAFISFLLEWGHRSTLADLAIGKGTLEPFFIHLFKGCLLFESLQKNSPVYAKLQNNKNIREKATIGELACELKPALGNIPTKKDFTANWEKVLSFLKSCNDSLDSSYQLTAKMRNALGHNLGWENRMNARQYNDLASHVTASCLHAIACLY